MKLIIVKDYQEMTDKAYDIFKNILQADGEKTISINTGATPKGLFDKLVLSENEGEISFENVNIFNLDEYRGPNDAIYSVQTYMKNRLLKKLKNQPKNMYFIDGNADNPEDEIKRYEKLLNSKNRDIQLLGLGTNGHIGANEPGTDFNKRMFLADHTESTIQATMNEYGITYEDTPKQMYTLGLKDIVEAKEILLLVSGKKKAEAVKKLVEEEMTPELPASILKNYDNATVIIDNDAASLLRK